MELPELTEQSEKLPFSYSRDDCLVRDAEGRVLLQVCEWRYNWHNRYENEETPEKGHAISEFICYAINQHTALERQVAQYEEMLGSAQQIFFLKSEDHTTQYQMELFRWEKDSGWRVFPENQMDMDGKYFDTALEAWNALKGGGENE